MTYLDKPNLIEAAFSKLEWLVTVNNGTCAAFQDELEAREYVAASNSLARLWRVDRDAECCVLVSVDNTDADVAEHLAELQQQANTEIGADDIDGMVVQYERDIDQVFYG